MMLPTDLDDFDLLAHQRLSRDELEALQRERLRDTLSRAYAGNAHYRTAWDAVDVHPSDVHGPADLARLPFTTKEDLRRSYPFGFLSVSREQLARVHASSGTTGQPTVVGSTREDLRTWAGLCARSVNMAGGRAGDLVHVAYGYGLFTGGLGLHYGAEALGCAVVPMSGGQTDKQVQLICDLQPNVICVTPSYMLALLDGFRAAGLDPRRSSLRVGIFGAEPWSEAMRIEIEDAFALVATNIYGLSEVMGPGVAQESGERRDGLTIWEDHFLPEVVDPESGQPVPDGAWGELVITTLTRHAMPVIRYRTRDRTRFLPPGSGAFRRLDRLQGRTDDMLIVRGVNLFPGHIEELVLSVPELGPHYLIEVSRPGRMDELLIRVEARPGVINPAAASRHLGALIKERTGINCAVEVGAPGALARSAGKAARVIDKR